MLVYIIVGLVVLCFIAFEFWRYKTSDKGAPFVPLNQNLVERLLDMAKVKESDVVYDLGSGDGRIPITAALKHKATSVGIEIDRLRYLYSLYQVWLLRLKNKVRFLHADLFSVNLSSATVVTMFLLPETNKKLMEKLIKELKPGTKIVSAAFNFPGWKPVLVDREHSTPYGPLYLYILGISDKDGSEQPQPSKTTLKDHVESTDVLK